MKNDEKIAPVAAVAGFGGLFAAAACCVLPLALAGVGVGASSLVSLSPLHAPLSAIALLAVIAGWYFYAKRRRACAADSSCEQPSRATVPLLVLATVLVTISGIWPFIEAPLMRVFQP
jgi:mercuric ion transport protein